ncbi:hypothetical protein T4B_783 [Trichinella pseudospiralis]|uniref:Uncharacterized protein n=2 Tax=Trichinella pseudospiralis TaxID=6337 RepID=A0A0V1HQ61_TRIPS|nr:hypothetical protein T4D_11946 [Trichinella pseudospiralis]KRZ11319.1 hypothetical protein T4B_4945 [Trichinella pseudospiralis]KRZ12400.1 hypothetical protein T4B_783 [Trichinella pseudospiralis]
MLNKWQGISFSSDHEKELSEYLTKGSSKFGRHCVIQDGIQSTVDVDHRFSGKQVPDGSFNK